MEAKNRVFFPSAIERLRKMSISMAKLSGDDKPPAEIPNLYDQASGLPDNRVRPLFVMELASAIHGYDANSDERQQIVAALLMPNNAEGLRLHLGTDGYGKYLAELMSLVKDELSKVDLTGLYIHRLTEYECALIALGAYAGDVRSKIEMAAQKALIDWNDRQWTKIAKPACTRYYPKVKNEALIYHCEHLYGMQQMNQFFKKFRSYLHYRFPFRVPPLIPSVTQKCLLKDTCSVYEYFHHAADIWMENGRQKSDYLQGDELMIFLCWIQSPGMIMSNSDRNLFYYYDHMYCDLENEYMRLLRRRTTCSSCHESFLLENLRFCVQCRTNYCVPCSSPFPLTLFNNPECPVCGNEIVG